MGGARFPVNSNPAAIERAWRAMMEGAQQQALAAGIAQILCFGGLLVMLLCYTVRC